jgi:predicted PurR-regulated permease PerM
MDKPALSVQRLAYSLVSLTIIIYFSIVAKNLLIPFVFSILLLFLLKPICSFVEGWIKNRLWSIIITFVIVTMPVVGSVYFFSVQSTNIFKELPAINDKIRESLMAVFSWAQSNLPERLVSDEDWLQNNLIKIVDQFFNVIGNSLTSSTIVLTGIILTVIYTFLLLLYRSAIKNFLIAQFARETQSRVRLTLYQMQNVVRHYFYGLVTVILILGCLNSLGLLLIGINYPFFWGFLAALLAIIPYIGTTLGGFLPFLYALASTTTFWQPAAVVLMYAGIQQLEGNIITPKVVGSSVKINPLAAIISLFIGGTVWGLPGLILALPGIAVLRILFDKVNYLKPYSLLLSDHLQGKEKEFITTYNKDKYRLLDYFRIYDRR